MNKVPEGKDTAMTYSIYLALLLATVGGRGDRRRRPRQPLDLTDVLEARLGPHPRLWSKAFAAARCRRRPPRSSRGHLQQATRELGRVVGAVDLQPPGAGRPGSLADRSPRRGQPFRRLAKKTPQQVSTLFGTISLAALGYRAAPADGGAGAVPAVPALGLVHGATPALVERVAPTRRRAGRPQKRTLARLRQEHGVGWGVKRLRQVTEFVAQAMEDHRHEVQAEQVLRRLTQAQASRGQAQAGARVGRDGITLGLRIKGSTLFEVATTATLSVYDRRGKRLGTVYLAYTPEPGQATMSSELTRLLAGGVAAWQGPLPRLCYVTDAGDNETTYYRKVLQPAAPPAHGQAFEVDWVVDYYHARAVVDDGGGVVRHGAGVVGLGAEDAEVAAEAGRRGPGAALGGGVA